MCSYLKAMLLQGGIIQGCQASSIVFCSEFWIAEDAMCRLYLYHNACGELQTNVGCYTLDGQLCSSGGLPRTRWNISSA